MPVTAFSASNIGDTPSIDGLQTQINDFLAAQAADTRICRWNFVARDSQKRKGKDLHFLLSLDTGGSVSLTDPFQIEIFQGRTLEESKDALDTFMAANPTFFFSTPIFEFINDNRPSAIQPFLIIQFYSEDPNAASNYCYDPSGSGSTTLLAGDVTGAANNNTVIRIQNTPVDGAPVSGGSQLTYDAVAGELVWYIIPTYTSLANAAADQANQVIGQMVIVFGSAGGAEDGTYQLDAKTGATGDYTKISDATNTASEVAVIDAGGFYVSGDVEGVLQELGPAKAAASSTQVALANGANVVGNVPFVDAQAVIFEIALSKGTESYSSRIQATHDGSAAVWVETDVVFIPGSGGTFDFIVAIDDAAGIALSITTSSAGWTLDYLVRRI